MSHEVRILEMTKLNHDVIQFHLEKPEGYNFAAGQAIELTLDTGEKRGPAPFTFTGLNSWKNLELTIKIYEEHHGLTAALRRMSPGDKVIISDPWDSFTNKGPGVFIAGGAGITPFIALLRQLHVEGRVANSQLLFFNKTSSDVFLHTELKRLLGPRYVDVITRGEDGSKNHDVTEEALRRHINKVNQPFYLCGPPGFVEAIQQQLVKIGATEELVNISL